MVVVATLVGPPTMIAMTAVPFMTFASAVSSILLPPIWAFAPPASTLSPETSARPEGGEKQQDREFSHLKPSFRFAHRPRVGGGSDGGRRSIIVARKMPAACGGMANAETPGWKRAFQRPGNGGNW